MPTDFHTGSMAGMAEHIRDIAGRKAQILLAGPPLIYGKDGKDHVMAMMITGTKQVDSIDFGRYIPEVDKDCPLYQAANTVLVIQRAGDITLSEAREHMVQFVEEAGKLFDHVETFACDKELVKAYVKRWPCGHSRNLAKDIWA